MIDTLREELHLRERRLDQVLNEKNSILNERERHISELQVNIRERERELIQLNEKLRHIEEQFDVRQHFLSRSDLIAALLESRTSIERVST